MPPVKKMRAAILYGKEDVRVESVPVPVPDTGEILVRVRAALTCGTDLKVFQRGYHALMIQPPALFGHEVAGDVAAIGKGVAEFTVGERVVAANSAPCDSCFFCRRGQQNLCEDLLFNNGAYAEYIRIPDRIVRKNTHLIPDDLSYKHAAMAEPLACAIRGMEESAVRPGDTVAVLGLGPIGLMFVRLARYAYGARVIAIARRVEQIDRAMMLGAHEGILLSKNTELSSDTAVVSEVKKHTDGHGADVVIEAVGRPAAWELAMQLVRRGGRVNFFGGCTSGAKVKLDTDLLHYSEITCKASFHHTPAHIARAIELLEDGTVNGAAFVNDEKPLSALPQLFADLAHHRNGEIKTAIIP
jgi:L-iditol 2-dehydrogenase